MKNIYSRRLVVGLLYCLSGYLLASNAYGAFGDLVTSYSFPASSFVMSPTEPLMYATVPSQNSIAIINTNTLAAETVVVGSGPTNLAFSPDGSKAYIANSTSNSVVVFDTQTRTVINSFTISEHPQDVVFANQNRLFVLGDNHIFQIDATTGASTGPNVGNVFVYSGSLEISADRNTLYYGQYGLSSSTMYKFNISGTTPILLLSTEPGENGEDLTLSHDGNSICHPNGYPYLIAKYRTSDFATLGSFNTGAYPSALCFSPDDSVAYASVHTAGGIQTFDANRFVSRGTITGPEVATKLAVDSTGKYLFAAYSVYYSDFMGIRVYDTGRNAAVISAPTATAASNVVSSGFTANWSPITVATGYRLDVSLNNTFSTYLAGYQDRDVGNVTNFSISGLNTGTTYYYRVRAYGPPGTSGNSNIISVITAQIVSPGFGHVAAQYSFPSSALVMSPTQPYMYATVPSQNCVAIINANTLAVESTPLVGSGPANLAFSPDGSKAYIANSNSNFVVVLDTQTRTVINSLFVPEYPQDVVFANQNRLFVLGDNHIFQIDATTGASTGPNVGGIYSGSMEISPDRNTLYYGDYGVSPSTMYKFDISGVTPVLLMQTPFGTVGSNGEDLTLSYNGSFICYATGSGQNGYQIAKFRTSDFATLGSFNTGPYPQAVAFSPDDSVVYASVDTASAIKVFDANTFLSAGSISGPDVTSKLAVDSTGRYLFAGYSVYYSNFMGTRVYDTGRVIALGAVSRKTHGAAGAFDVTLPLTGTAGIECRAGGATNDYTIVVTFAGNISVTGSPQAQVTAGFATIGSGGTSNGGAVSVSGSTVTIPLTNVANAQTINVRLNGLPVGATSTGTMTIPMSILIGDTTANLVVNASDVTDIKSQAGKPVTASNFRDDVTANGSINASDISLVKSQSSSSLTGNQQITVGPARSN